MEVYKSGGSQNDYLITLEIDPNESNTNLSRKVDVPTTAKYRCRRAFVKSIEHKTTGGPIESIESNYSDKFRYTVGLWVEEPGYDHNIQEVCTQGIHFFKSREPALHWGWHPENGPCKTWYENGRLESEVVYKNDNPEGPYREWYENGQLALESIYREGKFDGPRKRWYPTGRLWIESTFKGGKLEGPFKRWHENGQLSLECRYRENKLDGTYKEWLENGQLYQKRTYNDNKLRDL